MIKEHKKKYEIKNIKGTFIDTHLLRRTINDLYSQIVARFPNSKNFLNMVFEYCCMLLFFDDHFQTISSSIYNE